MTFIAYRYFYSCNQIFAICSLLESYSTYGKFRAVLMKGKSSKMKSGAEPQQFIEVSNYEVFWKLQII